MISGEPTKARRSEHSLNPTPTRRLRLRRRRVFLLSRAAQRPDRLPSGLSAKRLRPRRSRIRQGFVAGTPPPVWFATGLVRAGLVRAGLVRAGLVRAGLVRAGLVRAGLVRAGLVRAGLVRAGLSSIGMVCRRSEWSVVDRNGLSSIGMVFDAVADPSNQSNPGGVVCNRGQNWRLESEETKSSSGLSEKF
ncbi:hypothetical protein SV7mr_12530 [Stieleria bergensis]|uniref:Uncharacterized protein n=1 Tax=Stieleria bergensis TaxID=2528025 RepID=A0A517SRK2_9BACT|nr:hypothetical protein SV7mr_12530 [Planctomycetes bacterium SV_7m_r]